MALSLLLFNATSAKLLFAFTTPPDTKLEEMSNDAGIELRAFLTAPLMAFEEYVAVDTPSTSSSSLAVLPMKFLT